MTHLTENYTVSNSPDTVVLSIRLKGAEAVRYTHILEAAFKRNPYIDKTHAIRELLGLAEPDVLTAEEVSFFRRGKRRPDGHTKISGQGIATEAEHPIPMSAPLRKRKTG